MVAFVPVKRIYTQIRLGGLRLLHLLLSLSAVLLLIDCVLLEILFLRLAKSRLLLLLLPLRCRYDLLRVEVVLHFRFIVEVRLLRLLLPILLEGEVGAGGSFLVVD